ncbi:transcriptional regulator [Halopseudomonas xinjiangensis]|uniref:Transcriptional regulator n=1 Tax=Halopseudomonas xinjiangensis TaxID=487184 RepID=A0A1H1YCR9_9GAMM|nr:cupin domain-containing protein [Halopseudomonas xinjiangensis]SDT19184.1 transcriptional regulator [Halopseudomonas xinjiangensis]
MPLDRIIDFATSPTPAEHYRPAPEKILKGDPAQNVRNHYSSPDEQFSTGVWEAEPGQWSISYSEHEYCEILEGESILRDEQGNARTVRTGDRLVIPAGFSGTWEVVTRTRKVYVIYEPAK